MLAELDAGNATLAAAMLERSAWEYDPAAPAPRLPASDELLPLIVCADSYDAPEPPGGLAWWDALWADVARSSWIDGNSRFLDVLPCRRFGTHWPPPAVVFRGGFNATLRRPVLLIAETHDPATPLRNGRRLLAEMGPNARLVVHGYGHSSRDTSRCTDAIAKAYILHGVLPDTPETACYADEKPYRYSVKGQGLHRPRDPLELWDEHLAELAVLNPKLLLRG